MAKKKVWIHPEGERVPAAEYQHLSQKDMDYDGHHPSWIAKHPNYKK